jgi:hypothetical protein
MINAHDPFTPPPLQARTAATTLITASLAGQTTEMRTALYTTPAGMLGATVHATLSLYRALASRLVTPAAMIWVDGGPAEIADDDPSPDRRLAAQLLLAHSQCSPTLPVDNGEVILHNTGVEQFNAALKEANEHGGCESVFLAALGLLSDLLNGKGAGVLDDVAAELWPATE